MSQGRIFRPFRESPIFWSMGRVFGNKVRPSYYSQTSREPCLSRSARTIPQDLSNHPGAARSHPLQYRPEIDGLRALAVVPVILFHAGFQQFSGGFTGVDVFFVISGYLIAGRIMSDHRSGRFSLADFFERRARRILPAMMVVLLVCLPAAWSWLLPHEMVNLSQSLLAVMGLVSNVLFWMRSGYFDPANETAPLIHTWSLSVEEQFYLIFPLLMMLGWRVRFTTMLGAAIALLMCSLALAVSLTTSHPVAAFYSLPTRAWELLVGAVAAILLSRTGKDAENIAGKSAGAAAMAGIALIVAATATFDDGTPFPGIAALVPVSGALMVIVFASDRTLVGRVLSSPPLVGLGLISYGAYLWHQPIFAFARLRLMREPSSAEYLLLATLAVVCAAASWRYVETPFRDRRRVSRVALMASVVVGGSAVLAFSAASLAARGFPERISTDAMTILEEASADDARRDTCHFSGAELPLPGGACIIGDDSTVVGALLGDSHAAALSGPLATALHHRGLGLRSLTYSSCPPATGLYRVEDPASRCDEFNEMAAEHVLADPKMRFVVLAARWTLYLEKRRFDDGAGGLEPGGDVSVDEIRDGRRVRNPEDRRRSLVKARYADAIRRFVEAGKTVILVYPIPEAGHDVPVHLARAAMLNMHMGGPALTTSWKRSIERNKEVTELFDSLADSPQLLRIRPGEVFCNAQTPGRCLTHEGGRLYYVDSHHLSELGASMVIGPIVERISRDSRSGNARSTQR
jgi:peptidoglycan/LPS O-acetylase OafA/YrhL